MKFLKKLFSRPKSIELPTPPPCTKENEIGSLGRSLIIDFLRNSSRYELSIFTYTELFAFFLVKVDVALVAKEQGDDSRMAVNRILNQSFTKGVEEMNSDQINASLDAIFNQRADEYEDMIITRKENLDQVKKLHEYLIHSSDMKCFHQQGDPVLLTNPLDDLKGWDELTEFYAVTLRSFLDALLGVLKK